MSQYQELKTVINNIVRLDDIDTKEFVLIYIRLYIYISVMIRCDHYAKSSAKRPVRSADL